MGNFNNSDYRNTYFNKKYNSGIENLKLMLEKDLQDDNLDKGSYIEIIAIIKKNGFKPIIEILNNNINFVKKDVFENFLDDLKKAAKSYDEFNVKKDFIDKKNKKNIEKEFKNLSEALIKVKYSFDIEYIEKLAKLFEIEYNLYKEDIKNSWNDNTYFYLKGNFDFKNNSKTRNLNKFMLYNLKNNYDKLIKSFDKLFDKNDDKFLILMNQLNEVFNKNLDKYNKIPNYQNFLNQIIENISFKTLELKNKINNNQIEFDNLKNNTTINKDIIIEANKSKNILDIKLKDKERILNNLSKDLGKYIEKNFHYNIKDIN